jgi:hypothetical protein
MVLFAADKPNKKEYLQVNHFVIFHFFIKFLELISFQVFINFPILKQRYFKMPSSYFILVVPKNQSLFLSIFFHFILIYMLHHN